MSKRARQEFLPFAPDFTIEVKSHSDRWKQQHEKCLEYMANGTSEAWLIHPAKRTVCLYTAGGQVTESKDCDSLRSQYVPSFTMDLRPIWEGLDI